MDDLTECWYQHVWHISLIYIIFITKCTSSLLYKERYLSNCIVIFCGWLDRMLVLACLAYVFNIYVQLLEIYRQNSKKIKIFVTKCTSSWLHKERYLSNCVVILCGWLDRMLILACLAYIFNLYIQLLEIYWKNSQKIKIFVTKRTSSWLHKERYLSNCVVILCGWLGRMLILASQAYIFSLYIQLLEIYWQLTVI